MHASLFVLAKYIYYLKEVKNNEKIMKQKPTPQTYFCPKQTV